MEPSSGQNSSRNGNDTQTQASSKEPHGNDDPVAPEENPEDNKETTEGPEREVIPDLDSLVAKNDKVEQSAASSEIASQASPETSVEVNKATPKKLPIVLTYAARNRPRQPFFGGTSTSTSTGPPPPTPRAIPAPPSYYPNRNRNYTQPIRQQPAAEQDQSRPEHQYNLPQTVNPLTNPFVNPFTNVVIWAPYPPKISSNVPSYLAHLADAEVVFVVQHLEAFEFFGNIELPNVYLIQNKNGETIYYVYESTLCIPCLCKNSRALQLHVMDMYQNEVIFMNKSCGCGLYFCCFPFIEVYSPPSVPIGAVIKKCHPYREQFNVVDADENLMFRIYGDCSLLYCSRCLQYDFSIHALDSRETEVGYIRRDFPGIYQYLLGSDYYGVSFPANMDVRIKAVFLGALFLIDFLYFE